MFGKKRDDNGEKVYRYSIRKYHFGAASVAIAALIFFANGVAKADMAVSPATANSTHQTAAGGGGDSSGDSGSAGDPNNPAITTNSTSEVTTPTRAGISTGTTSVENPVVSDSSNHSENAESTASNVSEKTEIPTVTTDKAQGDVTSTEAKKVNVTDLKTALEELESKVASITDEAKKAKLNAVIAEAKKVLEDKNATQEQIDSQVTLVKDAVKSVQEVAKKGDETKPSEENRSATVEAPNREITTPARSPRGRRGRNTDVQPESAGGSNLEAETAPKALPTYTNGTDNYALAEEMRKIVKYLQDNGADAAKVASIKDNYDKLNEKLGLTDENAVLSEADFAAATANLKAARDFTEGFLRKQDENGQPLNEQPTVPETERSVGDESRRTERSAGQPRYIKRDSSRDSKAHYNVAKEYYYEDGTKGSSPYDKYTYLFHTFTESLVANNANHSPVRDIKRLVYAEVNEIKGGYSWTITFNAAHEAQQDGYAFFSIPKGQRVDNSSINVVKTAQNGNEAEVDGSGDLLSRLKMIHPNSTLTGKEIVVRRNGGAEEESLQGLATSSAYAGYYTRRLETANNEIEKSNNMFEKIMSATEGGGKVYRFQLHGRDSYTISFKTINENRTRMDKLYYAAGYRVQQWGRRILAEQWHGRHDYDQDDTDRFPLHVVGNGTFLIKQGKHYNTAYPQGAYGFGGRDYDYNPFRADGILGYDASGAYNSNFDMHQYTAPEGSDTPSSNTKATTAGQKFEFYDKEGNKLSASQIGMHGADKPGLVEYKVKRTFTDKSSDFLNIKFAIQPKTPTFTENIANSRGQTKNLTVSNGTNGYPITLFREYMENGAKKIEKVATVNANSGGNAVFNNVLIKSGKYYAQSIIPTAAYYDYDNRKHTDVHSDKSTEQEVLADGMAPTIQVGESGKPLATTPANNQVTLFVTPNNKGEVSLDVQIKDDELGDGMNAFSSGTNGNAKYSITGDHNSGATAFTAKGGVTGGKTVNALLKVKLNGTTIPNGGLTVKLNAKDKAGNWTDTATPAKTLTVKLLSAVPNEPAVRMITGNDVQNGAIKTDVKNQVLESVKNANPDLVKAGVKFEYDTTAGNTDKIKVTYPDGQTRLLTPTKGTKPTAPVVVGPQDGTVSITPQGDTDKVTFQYVPTNQTNLKEIIAKKDGNSWAIQGTRPDGITVDSRTGKITITEPTVKDQSPVTATATFLNSDTSDTARDTAKNPDRQAPEVWMNGKKLTETATDNKFLIYRGATFNPTFRVEDNSGTTDTFMIKNIPNGVWFNKQGNRDVAHTGVANGREITFSNQVVAPETPLGTREAIVSVRDKNGNAAEYKFQYIIADVLLKNSPKSVATGSKLGDSHQFVASTLNGTTSNDDVYFPGNMKFLWANNETENTTLPNSAQTVTKEAIVEFPYTALNGKTTANGITIYAPKQIKKNVTFNLADNEKPQATLNGISIGQTAGDPIFTVFRGANFNPQLEAWDNSGKITNVTISGLPTNATATPFPGGVQTGSESRKYTARLSNGVVPADQALGEHEATLTVQGDGPKDTSVLKFKYRVVDMDFKNGYETADAGQRTGKSYVIGLKNNQSVNLRNGDKNINPKDYWKVIDDANKTDRGYAYLPEGVSYSIGGGAISSNPADKSKGAAVAMGHYGRGISVDFTRAGDIANDNSTSRAVFTPRTIDRRLLVAVDPSAPTIDGGEDLLYGKAGERPDIKVKEIVNIGESDADVGTVNKNAIRTIQLYSDSDPNTPIAEHEFARGSRETEYTFRASDYAASRPNGLLADETIYSRVKVTHRGVSTLSGNSNEKEVTAKLDVRENATNRIIQANDQKLNDAEKTGIRIALRNANPTLNLSDENIEISDSGAIVITKDKKRAWLQTNPNKKDGNTTTGFITRFANIRDDYKFENIDGLKVPGRDTDKGFAWSDNSTGGTTNGNRSLVYYYDATKGKSFNFNDVLKVLNLREGWTVNHTENPSFVATQGVNKAKAEGRQDGFSMSGTTFLKDGNYINVIDLVDRGSLSGGQNVSNSANKLVQQGKGGGTDTNLQNVTIAAANGLPGFTLTNVVNGEQAIHKAQVYLRPKYVNAGSLAERNGETKDTTTNVVNLYFVPIDPVKPVVEPSDSNELGASADNAPRLTDTSITASSLVKVTDNYDRDDLGTGATTSTTGTATPTTGTTLANEVRKRLNVWVKKDGVKTQVVENGVEKTTANGETVLGSLIKTVDPATYELVAQASDTSGNRSEEESLGFFKVGYNLDVRPVINFIQHEKLTDDDKRTLVRVNEGGQLEELPNGATVNVTFDTENVNGDYQEKRATATITFANGATTTKVIPYKVYKSFPMANKVYDFAGATKYSWYHDGDYYINNGLAQGLNWFAKREVEENGRTVLKDIPPITNGDKDDSIMARELNKDTAKGVGEYKYSYGATYPTGRYSATTTDELLKLRREGEIVHTVFDVGANDTNKLTVNSGDTLTADQAKAAVMPINGSKELPEGTKYEWVNSTVTGRGGTEVERQVKVTLVADPHGPYASNYPRVKTVTVKVKIEDVKPTVKIKFGNNDSVALTTNAEDNRFVIFKGATFNPTFIVDDNSGKTASINITGLPNGRSVKKTETMTNGTNVTVTDADAVTRDATTGTREASVTVADAAGNTETYKFKYTVEDAIPKEETKTVPLGTKLGTDSHDYVKLAVSTAPDRTVYPSGMTFKWKKDNVEVTRETAFSEPGRVTGYKAVVKFPTAGFYTINGVRTFVPESIERDVTFLVKPTKPTVTPDNNGDVRIGHTNETNVSRVEVTYTPTDNNRLEDNGNVTKTAQDRTTVIATKGTDNQWHITSGEKEGISVNPTTGEITLKDQVVKDQTKIQAKVIAQEVSSDENDTNNSKDGDRKIPTIDINNTLVEVGKEFSLPLGLSDGAGVGVDYTNIKVSSPNGETGLTYDATTKSIKGTINAATKKEITVRVLDKNGNKAEKTISIAAVKAKPIYAIKDGTIKNVDTPSNFVEMPAGLTASWKDDSRPTTAEAGNTKKTVTVSAEGYNAINVDIPVTIYPKVTLRKVGGNEVDTYHEIVGKPLTSTIVSGGDATDFYVEFEGGNKPDGTTITFKGGNPASPSTTAGTTTKTIVVTYPNGVGTFEKTVTFKTYGNEAKYEDGKDSVETIVGSAFAKTNASDYVKPSSTLANPDGTVIGWGNGYTPYNPVNKPQDKIGKREENVNVWYGNNVEKQRGDTQHWYSDQNIKVTLAVKPQAPTLTANQFQGKAGTKPEITVNNLPTTAQLTTGSTVKVQLKDATDTVVAEKTVVAGTESTTFTETDYNNPVTLGQQLTANVIVSGTYQKTEKTDNGTRQVQTAYSLVSNNSNSEQVTPQKPTFDTTTVTSTSRTLSGTLGGFNDPNRVVKVYLNDEKNTVLSSENNGEVTINNDGTWTATLPKNVKLRQSVAKNGETTMPPAITVENTVTGGTVSTRSDNKAVEMGDYSVASTVAGSKHIDITVPHDAKRVELRFHNNQETGDKPNSIVLVRGTDGWHTEATRADNTTVTDANGYVGTITSTPSTANPSENNIRIALNEQSGTAKLRIKEENANGDNTDSYNKGLGLRVYNQPEAGQDPTATGKWKVVGVMNTAPVLLRKGTEGSAEANRKVYDSGTSITKEMLAELVTVTDPEDNATDEGNKPYGSPTIEIVSGLAETPGQATPAGRYAVVIKAVDSQGKESNSLTVYVGVVSTVLTYQPQVGGVNLGTAKPIAVEGDNHKQTDEVKYTPAETITEAGKVYVLKNKGEQTVHLTDAPQVFNVEYEEKPASTVLTYQPQVGGVNLGTAKPIAVGGDNHKQTDEVKYTPAETITEAGKVYVLKNKGEQTVHLTDAPQVFNVEYEEKPASTVLTYQPQVGGVNLGTAKPIAVGGDNHKQTDEVKYTPAETITEAGKVYVLKNKGEQTVHLTDAPQVFNVEYEEKPASTVLTYQPQVGGVNLGTAKPIAVEGDNHKQTDEVKYTPAETITEAGKVYVLKNKGEQTVHLTDAPQVFNVEYEEKPASTVLTYQPQVGGVNLGTAKPIAVEGDNHKQTDEVKYTPAETITEAGKVYVLKNKGEQTVHLTDAPQVFNVEYEEKPASTVLTYQPQVGGVNLGTAKPIAVEGDNHKQTDEVKYTPAETITEAGKVYVLKNKGEQTVHLTDAPQVFNVEYEEKPASTVLTYQPQVGGVNLGTAKPIAVEGDNHKQTDEVKYTPAETITEAGKVYVLKNKGEQTVHLTDAPQVFNVEYEEKPASTVLTYQPQVGGVNLGTAKPIAVEGDNHKQTDEVKYTPAETITEAGKVYVLKNKGEQTVHLTDAPQVFNVEYEEKPASTVLTYQPQVGGVNLGTAKPIAVGGDNHKQTDEVKYTPAETITEAGKVYVLKNKGEQTVHLTDAPQVFNVEYEEKPASTVLTYQPQVGGVNLGTAKPIAVEGDNHKQTDEVKYTPAETITEAGKVYVLKNKGEQTVHLTDAPQVFNVEYEEKPASTVLTYQPQVGGVNLGTAKPIAVGGDNHKQTDEVKYTPAETITEAGKVYVLKNKGEQTVHLTDAPQVFNVEYEEKPASTVLTYQPQVGGVNLGTAKPIAVGGDNHKQTDEVKYTPAETITEAGKVYVLKNKGEQTVHLTDAPQVFNVEYEEKPASTVLTYQPQVGGVNLGTAKPIAVEGDNHKQTDEVKYTPAETITEAGKVYVLKNKGEQTVHLTDAPQVFNVEYEEKPASTVLTYQPQVGGVNLGTAKPIAVGGDNHKQTDEVKYTPAETITEAGKVYVLKNKGEQTVHLTDAPQVFNVEYEEKPASTVLTYQPQVGGVNLGTAKPIAVEGDNHKQTDEVKYTPAETITEAGKVYVLKNKGEQTVHLTDAPQVFNVEYEEKPASTVLTYQPQVGGVNLGTAKPIAVEGDNHKQTDEVKYTPAETITEAGKVYVLKNKGEQTVHLTDAPQVFNVEYEEKPASTVLTYQPQVGGVNLGTAKPIAVGGDNHKQTDEVKYTPAETITEAGKVYVLKNKGEQTVHLTDAPQVFNVEYEEKPASTVLTYQPQVGGVNLGTAKPIAVEGDNHKQTDEVKYTPAETITEAGKVYVLKNKGEQTVHLTDAPQVFNVEYEEKPASTVLTYQPQVGGVNLGTAKPIAVEGDNHKQTDEVKYTPAETITEAGKVYVLKNKGEQTVHLTDAPQVFNVEYEEKPASTVLTYQPQVGGVNLGTAKPIAVGGDNHKQTDEVKYTPAETITEAGKVYVLKNKGEQTVHLTDAPQVFNVEYEEKPASTVLTYQPQVGGVNLGTAKPIAVGGDNHKQTDEVKYTPAETITEAGKVYVLKNKGEQTVHLTDAPQVFNVEYEEKPASTVLTYQPQVGGVNLGTAKPIAVEGDNHKQTDEVKYTPAETITEAGKVYVLKNKGEQTVHLTDAPQVFNVEYEEKPASTVLTYQPQVGGVNLGTAKPIAVEGDNHKQTDEVKYTPAETITEAGKVYVLKNKGEQTVHLTDAPQVFNVEYEEKPASTVLTYQPQVGGVNLGTAKPIAVEGDNHKQTDEVKYTPAETITEAGKVYVLKNKGEQTVHLTDAPQVFNVEYEEKPASTVLTYQPQVGGVNLGTAKPIAVEGDNHKQTDEVKYTPAETITEAGKVYVLKNKGEQTVHLTDAPQVFNVEYEEKPASTVLTYQPQVGGVNLGTAKPIAVGGDNHKQTDEVKYTPAETITEAGKVYVLKNKGEQTVHLTDAPQVFNVEYEEKPASTVLTYQPQVGGVNLGTAKPIAVGGDNHKQTDEVKYTPAETITEAGKVYVLKNKGEQTVHLTDAPQVFNVEYEEKPASTVLTYQPQVGGVNLGTAKPIAVEGDNHKQTDEVKYTPAETITEAGKVYVLKNKGEQTVHLTDAPQVFNVEYEEKPASTVLTYQPQVGGVNLGTAKPIAVGGDNHKQTDEVKYTPAETITEAGKVYVLKNKGEQTVHLTDAPQVFNVEYEEKPTTSTPTFTVGTQNPQTGNVEVAVGGVPEGTKVTLPGVIGEKVVIGGKVVLTHNDLPDKPVTGKGSAQEDGKLPKEGTSEITIPGKLTSAKGQPATEFEVTIPLPLVVSNPEDLTPDEKTELEKKVKKSNPNMNVKVDDKGNVTITDPKTGQSKIIPVKDLTVKDFEPVKPTEKVPVKDQAHLTPEEKKQVADKVKAKNPGKEVTVGDDGTATVTDPNTGISHTIPGTDLVNQDFTPVKPTEKVPVKDLNNLSKDEQDKVKESVEKVNPGKTVVVEPTGKVTITDPKTKISHELSGEEVTSILPPVSELPEYTNPIGTSGVDENGNLIAPPVVDLPEFTGGVNGELPEPTELPKVNLIITKWIDENGNELKPADAKAPTVLGEANEAFEHGEIEGYVFVRTETKGDVVTHIFRKVSPDRPTGDGQQGSATPSDDTNRRPDTAAPAEVPVVQPAEQPSQTVKVPTQLLNEVSETNPSVSQPQAVLPNTGTQEDRATGAFGLLSLLGAFGLLFAKKKKDDEEEA